MGTGKVRIMQKIWVQEKVAKNTMNSKETKLAAERQTNVHV